MVVARAPRPRVACQSFPNTYADEGVRTACVGVVSAFLARSFQ